ncbi:hypothetical protein EDB92DRAFT_1981233 [Lactarius akahatsu]|uniref:Uncharacterized protein n=1 Tax=Lactarius akahatsu TaxID=416441 RepID=A0AAD4Q2R5_9AGAM|nr:hypothetical protein EDB92DRAFT_1981233 [Lactarius akahatsu]
MTSAGSKSNKSGFPTVMGWVRDKGRRTNRSGSWVKNGATKLTRPLNTADRTSISKLLTKFAAPNPFPNPKLKPLAKPKPSSATQSSTKQSASTPQKPVATQKSLTEAELNIGKYNGGFKIENEKHGEAVQGEAARELALDSSVSSAVSCESADSRSGSMTGQGAAVLRALSSTGTSNPRTSSASSSRSATLAGPCTPEVTDATPLCGAVNYLPPSMINDWALDMLSYKFIVCLPPFEGISGPKLPLRAATLSPTSAAAPPRYQQQTQDWQLDYLPPEGHKHNEKVFLPEPTTSRHHPATPFEPLALSRCGSLLEPAFICSTRQRSLRVRGLTPMDIKPNTRPLLQLVRRFSQTPFSLMEQASPTPGVSLMIPSVCQWDRDQDLGFQLETLEIEKTPELPTRGTATVKCERKGCQKLTPQITVRKVKTREADGTAKAMFICPNCFNHYQTKSSTPSVNWGTRSFSAVNFEQIQKDIAVSQRGNQSNVITVKTGRQRQPMAATVGGSHRSTSVQSLVPVGRAPGPAGNGMPFKLPKLEVTLPEEYTTPFARKHYENLRDHLRLQTQAGGQNALTVLVNTRMTTQEFGRVKPTIITLLFNVFLPHWLKKYMDYPLSIDNIESVRLMRGRSGVHLDNREHAILEYCLTSNGTKRAVTELNLMLVLDRDHVEAAKAHRDSAPRANPNLDMA